ncbi:hypothetical protein C8J57DRAFT_1485595 [Mycena rebaudengoi]|nr:hypothetical protein C8J57DRAFT_1485595 [Mycena rebaudengoi]
MLIKAAADKKRKTAMCLPTAYFYRAYPRHRYRVPATMPMPIPIPATAPVGVTAPALVDVPRLRRGSLRVSTAAAVSYGSGVVEAVFWVWGCGDGAEGVCGDEGGAARGGGEVAREAEGLAQLRGDGELRVAVREGAEDDAARLVWGQGVSDAQREREGGTYECTPVLEEAGHEVRLEVVDGEEDGEVRLSGELSKGDEGGEARADRNGGGAFEDERCARGEEVEVQRVGGSEALQRLEGAARPEDICFASGRESTSDLPRFCFKRP